MTREEFLIEVASLCVKYEIDNDELIGLELGFSDSERYLYNGDDRLEKVVYE